jgi:hypothetical protein
VQLNSTINTFRIGMRSLTHYDDEGEGTIKIRNGREVKDKTREK